MIRERMTVRRCDQAVAYDAAYVALAEGLDAAFLTADARLARAVSDPTAVSLAS